MTAYAEGYDYTVYRIYQDDGFSGSTIEGRPAFRKLLIDCTRQKFDAILVVEHNRITRSENPEEVGKIQRILMENNIRIISPPEGVLDLKRPPDELVAWIKMWIAKEEKREIVEIDFKEFDLILCLSPMHAEYLQAKGASAETIRIVNADQGGVADPVDLGPEAYEECAQILEGAAVEISDSIKSRAL